MAASKPLLIDLNAEIANKGQASSYEARVQPERLSEEARELRDAIVRSHGNENHERSAEMSDPLADAESNNNAKLPNWLADFNSTSIKGTISGNAFEPTLRMRPELVGYLAGIFDGEGCVTVSDSKNRTNPHMYCLMASVVNTDLRIADIFLSIFGGHVWKQTPANRNWKPKKEWRVTGDRALAFLRIVYPHLIIKKRQAALAFKFKKSMDQTFRTKDAHRLLLRAEAVHEIKSLNHRAKPRRDAFEETVKSPSMSWMIQSTIPA